jgi:hypothetical protein
MNKSLTCCMLARSVCFVHSTVNRVKIWIIKITSVTKEKSWDSLQGWRISIINCSGKETINTQICLLVLCIELGFSIKKANSVKKKHTFFNDILISKNCIFPFIYGMLVSFDIIHCDILLSQQFLFFHYILTMTFILSHSVGKDFSWRWNARGME